MENIYIKVAFCKTCGGYHSSAPAILSQMYHPEIIDHYFYHGEPWFTLDQSVFELAEKMEATETKIMNLEDHTEKDLNYCSCIKKNQQVTKSPVENLPLYPKIIPIKQNVETEDFYFGDVYQLCYNFH